jgi:hypothetical protein
MVRNSEYRKIQQAARSRHLSIAEWVRQALARALAPVSRLESSGEVSKKLDAVRAAVLHDFPTGDIESMLAEIDSGQNPQPRS